MKHLKYFENIINNNEDEKRLISLCYHENQFMLPKFIEFLDEHPDVNINYQEIDNGWTPLLIAINNSGFEFGKILLDKGADSNIFSYTPELGKFPFDNDSAMFKMIDKLQGLEHQSTDYINKFWSFLHILIPLTDLNKQTDIFNRTPLIKVAENSEIRIDINVSLKMIKNLLKEEPNIEIKDNKGYDFIYHLMKKSNLKIIEELCNEFKSVNMIYNTKKFNI